MHNGLIEAQIQFDNLLDELEDIEKGVGDKDAMLDDVLDKEGVSQEVETAFSVMRDLMKKFKDYCECCEFAWKIQEIPAPLRQRLITLDQLNQDKYQKLYLLMQKYANEMRRAEIRKDS